MGYKFATQAGISICMADMVIPARKEPIIAAAQDEIKLVENQYNDGLITEGEKYNKVVDIWTRASDEVAAEMMNEVSVEYVENEDGTKEKVTGFNPIFMMADSGERAAARTR